MATGWSANVCVIRFIDSSLSVPTRTQDHHSTTVLDTDAAVPTSFLSGSGASLRRFSPTVRLPDPNYLVFSSLDLIRHDFQGHRRCSSLFELLPHRRLGRFCFEVQGATLTAYSFRAKASQTMVCPSDFASVSANESTLSSLSETN